mgnify:CR=1 FL=1
MTIENYASIHNSINTCLQIVGFNKTMNSSQDCLECRLISGFGAMGMGAYIWSHAKNKRLLDANVMKVLAGTAFILGIARLSNFQFLKAPKNDT